MENHLNIVHFASECSPYVKSGGLGDVLSALPKSEQQMGHTISVFLPLYGFLKKTEGQTLLRTTVKIGKKKFETELKALKTDNGVSVFLVGNDLLFDKRDGIYGYEDEGMRFLFFNFASLCLLDKLIEQKIYPFQDGRVDLLHCHDWHAALIPQLLHYNHNFPNLQNTPTAFTIHNLAFQGPNDWWAVPAKKKDSGKGNPAGIGINPKFLNFTRRGITHANVINTVSERYAAEILTPKFGQGLDKLLKAKRKNVFGIINGVDYAVFNPKFDPYIYQQYDADTIGKKPENKARLQTDSGLKTSADTPLIGMVNRLTEQKGFELMMQIMPNLLKLDLQLIVVGSGDRAYIKYFRHLARKYPQKIAVQSPFTQEMASKVYAASDMYLMPSRFEPCGISQLISLRYGSVPIVHETGGLHDTVTDFNPKTGQGNGFLFTSYTKEDFLIAVVRALESYRYNDTWMKLAQNGMKESFSWDLPAKKYIQLYHVAMKLSKKTFPGKNILAKIAGLIKVQT